MLNHELESMFPALNGGVVTERHARICREQGHASHSVDGKDTGVCPRCGDVTQPADAETYGIGWSLESDPTDIPPPPYKLCRACHGWGTVTVRSGEYVRTEDCRQCAGTGEES